jgi:hypothetical protein
MKWNQEDPHHGGIEFAIPGGGVQYLKRANFGQPSVGVFTGTSITLGGSHHQHGHDFAPAPVCAKT